MPKLPILPVDDECDRITAALEAWHSIFFLLEISRAYGS
jgi:hypothetical protein